MPNKNEQKIAIWLFTVCIMIFVMIILGGVTRLTESGLSMVNWHPISGIIPPLSEDAWQEEFNAYKQFPEYSEVNMKMSLEAFKSIFFWEFAHRILGRLIGIAFFLPFLTFLIKGHVKPELKPKLWIMLGLGAAQGGLGWWMVKSGLVDQPDVSHYRLTMHLGLAVFIYMYIFWVACCLIMKQRNKIEKAPLRHIKLLIFLIYLQILLGGLVAGLNAGLIYNSWPLMGEHIIPPELFVYSPWYINIFENMATVQFNHRMLAYIIVCIGIYLWLKIRILRSVELKKLAGLMLFCIFGQLALGISTLLYMVPIPIAVAHQAGAIIVLSITIILLRIAK